MEYRCIRKCYHKERLFDVGDIMDAVPGEKVPHHFEAVEGTTKSVGTSHDAEDKDAILEALKAEADVLGIEAKGNWGINAYTKAIEKAKADAGTTD